MDGWGHGSVKMADAIQQAKVPFVRSLYTRYPNAELITCGESVGLPDGQMGNSEVGHLNIGAGRIVYQELQRINQAIKTGELSGNEVFRNILDYSKQQNKTLHLIGLLSDGGVHSHINHLKDISTLASNHGIQKIAIHVFTDGRDTDPKSGLAFVEELQRHIADTPAFIASVCGRYWAMDRDKRWDRVKKAYDLLVHGQGQAFQSAQECLEASYREGITDEFIEPAVRVDAAGKPLACIQEGDAVLCYNFRTDRCREITEMLTQREFQDQGTHPLQLHYVTLTEYDKTFLGVRPIFRNDDLKNTLGEVLSANQKTQLRIAETEKYPHVTFFFSGGRETPFDGESRIMIPSPKEVPTYDLKPEMSAPEITEAVLPEIEAGKFDFICLNFANADMVGHTGVWEAAIRAVETVDHCVQRIVEAALKQDYVILLTADHGNSDYMINEDGTPNTAHTLNPVPFFVISNWYKGAVRNGKLGDIAPTILRLMELEIPTEMQGAILVDG